MMRNMLAKCSGKVNLGLSTMERVWKEDKTVRNVVLAFTAGLLGRAHINFVKRRARWNEYEKKWDAYEEREEAVSQRFTQYYWARYEDPKSR